MDWRMKSFEAEARTAFAFLTERGFVVGTEPPLDAQRRPASVVVRFQGPGATVETSLVLGSGGEDSIHTSVRTVTGTSDFGPAVAHKGHEMKKALVAHAQDVRLALTGA